MAKRSIRGTGENVLTLTPQVLAQNAILQGLEPHDVPPILKIGKLVYLATREQIYTGGEVVHDAFFPIGSVLSVVTRMQEGGMIEVGTIGREGTSAIPLLMGATTTANDSFCQVPGLAVRIPADHFHHLRTSSPRFRSLLDRYLQGYVNFLGQLAGCNRLHSVYERCSRWLLLTHDRVGQDSFSLTHEYLALMLGSTRSGVSIGLATLKRAGFVDYANGRIEILDRPGLEEASCECYLVARAQFGGLLQNLNDDFHD
ncbi:MAG TPA: Crp/Fnr family transcriptional regulator, partial [Candidatus Baltobacteraceae bacterium]|nr:Crp/Fnr family transcriptional regulator [Candidatus Baltobacteraceae bacterium]